jgi:hypothetical protein
MKTFLVMVREVYISYLQVEAKDRNEAVANASRGEGKEIDLQYAYTKDETTWSVREKEGDENTYYYHPATNKFDKRFNQKS